MAGDVIIRSAEQADAGPISALMTQLGYPSTPSQIDPRLARMLAHPDYTALVAEAGRDVVALVIVHLEHNLEYDAIYGRIMGLVVDEGWRGRGLGKRLMWHVEQWCKAQGAGRIVLTSANRRVDSHKFYDALGYERTGIRFAKWL
jgi:GNAT superfamily N-acetyltransferase